MGENQKLNITEEGEPPNHGTAKAWICDGGSAAEAQSLPCWCFVRGASLSFALNII
jgi:hypothetical protein